MVTDIHGILIGLLIGAVVIAIIIPFFHRREMLAYIKCIQSDIKQLNESINYIKSLVNEHHEIIVNNSTDNNLR